MQRDGEDECQPDVGYRFKRQDVERRRKRFELRREYDPLRWGSGIVWLPRKARWHVNLQLPVPETDTGREVENTKGREITLSKELGKMAP